MKKSLLINPAALAAFLALALAPSTFAASGIFGSGVELNANSAANATLYALDNGGTTRLTPTGSSAILDQTSWANATEASPVLNLGAFNPGAGDTLVLKGGSLLTFKNGLSDVTAAFLDYRVFSGAPSGAFSEVSFSFNQDNVSGNAGDQRWALESLNVDLLSALPNGSYTLGVFLRANTSDGGAFSSNGGSNYGASFSVVPEPGSLALVLGAGTLLLLRRRRA